MTFQTTALQYLADAIDNEDLDLKDSFWDTISGKYAYEDIVFDEDDGEDEDGHNRKRKRLVKKLHDYAVHLESDVSKADIDEELCSLNTVEDFIDFLEAHH